MKIEAKEFDKSVSEYNNQLVSLKNLKVQRKNKWYSFFRGVGSILDFFGTSIIDQSKYSHPVYSREDLTSEQKDAIALASDWQRSYSTLNIILTEEPPKKEFSVKDTTQESHIVREMYEHFKNVYVTNRIK